jgi:predicted DNA-binding transcriptional regulator AlpA
MRSTTFINGYQGKAMKRSTISAPGASPYPRVPVREDGARHGQLNDTFPNVTLSDIYKKLVELLIEIAKQKSSRKAIRLSCVKEMTGESRSQIYARMNPKCSAHDETWPLPFYVGKSPRWWVHEIEAWLEAQAASSTCRH